LDSDVKITENELDW